MFTDIVTWYIANAAVLFVALAVNAVVIDQFT